MSETQFEPAVEGLEEVSVSTGEEEELVLYRQRSRLFRYAREADPPQWKERGTGQVKLLQHQGTKQIRLLMRREKTLKICANHFVSPTMELTENQGSDRAWVWQCPADFAEGELTEETFAIRFRDSEIAAAFKAKFEEAAAINALIHENKTDELEAALAKLTFAAPEEETPEEEEKAPEEAEEAAPEPAPATAATGDAPAFSFGEGAPAGGFKWGGASGDAAKPFSFGDGAAATTFTFGAGEKKEEAEEEKKE
eukprot:TRINITY_DN1769_c0_g1_i1.p2 TRINITY_DN1769_c0_g1~~TRINITY_DN1769_c0_g1_i1.p2  ORF type:complete len:253 (+),score=-4.32 TRINITY_DN1769_c0_g1_i1:55-813(+)